MSIKKFEPFKVLKKSSSVHKKWHKMGYADPDERIINQRGEKSGLYPLTAFPRNQIGNCCGLVCIYGVGGDILQFELQLDLAIKQSSGLGLAGAGALMVALTREQVSRYHLSLTERNFRVIYGVHNSNYPRDADEEVNAHDLLLYVLEPERCYDQRRDYTSVEFEEE